MQIPTGDELQAARIQQGYTQTELASAAGISQPMVARIENDKVDPTVETLHAIAQVLTDGHDSDLSTEAVLRALPANIRARRKRVGMTQTTVADHAEISQPMMARIEQGKVNPTASTARAVIEVLNAHATAARTDIGPVADPGQPTDAADTSGAVDAEPVLDTIAAEFAQLTTQD